MTRRAKELHQGAEFPPNIEYVQATGRTIIATYEFYGVSGR